MTNGLETASWLAGIGSFAAAIVAIVAGRGARGTPQPRSGLGMVLALGGFGVAMIVVMVLGALLILNR